jgi:hypothetical protein
MKMKKINIHLLSGIIIFLITACNFPAPPEKKIIKEKHNYIILLDLSDRIIVQENQPGRDIELIHHIFTLFEEKVKKDLYIKSRDEIKVVVAPQLGSGLATQNFEDKLYVNIKNINLVQRRKAETIRRKEFFAILDQLYKKAEFSKIPSDYYGADIWKYFYEDLKADYSRDTLTKNFLFILTDGYPIVGKDRAKLQPLKNKFPDLNVILVEAAPREKDMEWDHIINLWAEWFQEIGISKYTLIKRTAISKEKEQLSDIVNGK